MFEISPIAALMEKIRFNEFLPKRKVRTNWSHIEMVPMSSSHTSLVCTEWPHFMVQATTNHTATCSVTRKNFWAGNYSAQLNQKFYIFISDIHPAKSLCWPSKPDEFRTQLQKQGVIHKLKMKMWIVIQCPWAHSLLLWDDLVAGASFQTPTCYLLH